jgi:hypothetical protein
MNAPQASVQRVRQDDYEIMLLHASPIALFGTIPVPENIDKTA